MRLLTSLLMMSLLHATRLSAAPELIVDIDVNDEVYMRSEPLTEGDVEQLVNDLHTHGADAILVRMGFLGLLPYRTQLSYPVRFDEADFRAGPRMPHLKDAERYIVTAKNWTQRYAKTIAAFNPPEVFIREGHKRGMKVIMWLDIFDDGVPGYRSKFLDENPHCEWTARDGTSRFRGVISYAWPEARAFRVAQARELLDLGADGIHCSTSAHSRHLPSVKVNDFYGFGQPVVDEYRKRHGVDIRSAPEFDREAWHTIKGEFMNQLYAELAAECHGRGKELRIGLQFGDCTHLSANPYWGENVVARYRNLWRPLVDAKIADAFLIGDYEICWQPGHSYWKAKALAPEPVSDLFAWAAAQYRDHCRGKTKLYLFDHWLPGGTKVLDEALAAWADHVLKHGFDGIDLHEAMIFEANPGGMGVLQRLRDRLDGKSVVPLD